MEWEIDLIRDFKRGHSIRALGWLYRGEYRKGKKLMPPNSREKQIEQLIRDFMNYG